ncbi:hypothetical protein WJX73_002590 [Symbiochloris irregularis]|uniref:phosphopantothenoylcysteine decarboxylase n=1 Tax=Symbiochloris irregularis TaxID=706552 RepID=A0AAW1NNR2_9CHLO
MAVDMTDTSGGDTAKHPHILLGVTGSVAAIKVPDLATLLSALGTVRVVTTAAATHFFSEDALPADARPVLGDDGEWSTWNQKGDPVTHIELRKWADCMVIAPLSANTLAKCAQGLCDNLLTCIVRAWDFSKPLLLAPAMNTMMWDSPFTGRQLAELETMGATVIAPMSKALACGDVGTGAMAEVHTVLEKVKGCLDRLPVCV